MGSDKIIIKNYERYFNDVQQRNDYYHNWKLCERWLKAIAATLGVPDAEPGRIADVVKHWLDVSAKLLDDAANLAKERDELLAQRDMLVGALEELSKADNVTVYCHAKAALDKVRGEHYVR